MKSITWRFRINISRALNTFCAMKHRSSSVFKFHLNAPGCAILASLTLFPFFPIPYAASIVVGSLCAVAASNDSVCDNGQTGVQDPDTDVCCPLECGEFCGGDGCGTIPGVDASQCCAAAIMDSGVICGEGVDAPCNQGSGEMSF